VKHERRGQKLESEDALHRRRFDVLGGERIPAIGLERRLNLAKDFDQKRSGAAARVEHEHVRVREAVCDVQLLAQHRVDAGNHVAHHVRRREPYTQALAQLGIIGSQERLVEILDRVMLLEIGKERVPLHAVKRRLRPVEHFLQPSD